MRPSWATVARLGSGVVETALFQFPTCSYAAAMALAASHSDLPVVCLRNRRASDPDAKIGQAHLR